MRLKKDVLKKLGAEAYLIVAMDLYRTKVFKEENRFLSTLKSPFAKDKKVVYGTALSDAAGYASAVYGVSRRCMRWGQWVENNPCWFVIDRKGMITYKAHPTFSSRTSYITEVDRMLKALEMASR